MQYSKLKMAKAFSWQPTMDKCKRACLQHSCTRTGKFTYKKNNTKQKALFLFLVVWTVRLINCLWPSYVPFPALRAASIVTWGILITIWSQFRGHNSAYEGFWEWATQWNYSRYMLLHEYKCKILTGAGTGVSTKCLQMFHGILAIAWSKSHWTTWLPRNVYTWSV